MATSLSSALVATLGLFVTTTQAADFDADVRSVLNDRCTECHGAKKQKASLRLDARVFAFKGGENGPVIQPGHAAESALLQRVRSSDPDEQMPPKGARLTPAQVAALEKWIEAGAVWPENDHDREMARDRRLDHWAWQPVKRPAVPPGEAGANPIDAFIDAKLGESGLARSPEADRRTLLRRLSFDLLGLPPTPEEVARFVSDPDPRAYEKKVDEYLASPHYGERWARHWLDIAHYADTHGFERDKLRENAWPYRDYVIRALNADKPYADFLSEQIAGDVLRPDDPQAVIATGFLAAGPWDFVGQAETKSEALKRIARGDDLDDMVTQVMTAACGVTINCARCHDHKLDPISQREYYGLWAVFAGVKRGDRAISRSDETRLTEAKQKLEAGLREIRLQLARQHGGFDLADIVGGGDGLGTGRLGVGIDQQTGKPLETKRGFLHEVKANQFTRSTVKFVDGVVIPAGGDAPVTISSTGLQVSGLPKTSAQAWDAIRNGPVNSQFTTTLGGVDYAAADHTLLSLHANSAITFDLQKLREAGAPGQLVLRAEVGYFGQTPKGGANYRVYVDGVEKAARDGIGHNDGIIPLEIPLGAGVRFLTFMALDGGNGITHDQICFADARLESPKQAAILTEDDTQKLRARRDELLAQIKKLPAPEKVYAVTSEAAPTVAVLKRGDPEQPSDPASPRAIACVQELSADLPAAEQEGKRRLALADWIVNPANPLTARVIVNRLWHHHFGTGLVDTPSDFGLGGGKPSHPELLDWLAAEFLARGGSLKAMHRLICTSATYRQQSRERAESARIDAANRLLWRMNPRRLEAESVRDAVLAVSGKLNAQMYGPGFRDFTYEEAYAPVYRYITADQPELWRRSIYRFTVRTTAHQFLTTLDCPNPANLTPARNVTTTALQSLALLNNEFMLKQAGYFAARVRAEAGDDRGAQARRALALAFAREATAEEASGAAEFIADEDLTQLCRLLLNANEFVYVD